MAQNHNNGNNNNGNTKPTDPNRNIFDAFKDMPSAEFLQKFTDDAPKKMNVENDEEKKEMGSSSDDYKLKELHKKAEIHEMKQVNEWLKTISDEDILNNAIGLCIGAAIGDSLGSFCEFSENEISDEKMSVAMQMNGGGPHHVVAGQITDDTELATCLAKGLVNICQGKSKADDDDNPANKNDDNKEDVNDENFEEKSSSIFDASIIGIEYKKWLSSYPFDIGQATGNSLYYGPDVFRMKHAANNFNIQCMIKYQNDGNLSNGSLMRCMPLIVYGHKLSNQNLYQIISEDSSLSHANEIIYIVNTMYAIGTRYLLLTTNEMEKHRNLRCIDIMINYLKFMKSDQNPEKSKTKSAETVYGWYMEMEKDKMQDATKTIAYIKIAVQRVWYHLKHLTSFEKAIYSVVKEGGDTDTNACIVGGILGAYFGFDKLPKEYIEKILNCQTRASEYMNDRKDFQAKYYLTENIVETLVKKAPNNDNFKIKSYKMDEEKEKELSTIEYIICNQCHFTRTMDCGAEDNNDHAWYCLECWSGYDD